ncbi:unnamed protein product [Effrenium voratum]|nr:unnamed protein product [Effrenium voratum]
MLESLTAGIKKYLERMLAPELFRSGDKRARGSLSNPWVSGLVRPCRPPTSPLASTILPLTSEWLRPVRPQYSTLHLQIRVNSGDVCPGEGRGVDLFRLQNRLKSDPECFKRDDETLFYEATANLRTALLKACDKASTAAREVGPMSLVLGL